MLKFVVPGVVVLGIVIFVHELGHFVMAKLRGVRVVRFSLGFGPAMWKRQRGETEYRVALVPAGRLRPDGRGRSERGRQHADGRARGVPVAPLVRADPHRAGRPGGEPGHRVPRDGLGRAGRASATPTTPTSWGRRPTRAGPTRRGCARATASSRWAGGRSSSWIGIFTANERVPRGRRPGGGRRARRGAGPAHDRGRGARAGAHGPAPSPRSAGGGHGHDRDAGVQGGDQGRRPDPGGERRAGERLGRAARGAGQPDRQAGRAPGAARRADLRPDRDADELRGRGRRAASASRRPGTACTSSGTACSSRWTWASARPAALVAERVRAGCGSR